MNRSWRSPLLISAFGLAHVISAQCPGVLPAFSWHSNGNAVVFQDQTTLVWDSIIWDLGDGTELNSESSVSHIYDVAAVDTVRLTVKKSGCTFVTMGLVAHGGDTEVCNDAITSDFSYGQTGNNEVAFSDQSDAAGANVISYWNFGDGSADLTLSPTHFYLYPGAYDVSHSIVTVDQQFTTACTAGQARKLLVRGNTSTCGTSVFLNLSVAGQWHDHR
jgi:PKD domain